MNVGVLSLELAQFYMMELVNVVEYMRVQKLTRRDIKLENLLLDANYHLKLSDFGTALLNYILHIIAKIVDKNNRGNTFVGTAEYVSPEVLSDEESGYSSDLWTIGCILYKFFAGTSPFQGNTEYLTLSRIMKGDITYPSVILNTHYRIFL
jgi:3-phosphoinositide dependent protein kinase-1